MRFLFALFVIMLLGGLFIAAIVYFLAKAFFSLAAQPGSKAWGNLLAALRTRIAPQARELAPWDEETLPLLSLNRENERKPGFLNNARTGVFTTIYQEPVLVYATQKAGKYHLTLAKTSNREFVYRTKGRETEIWLNGQPLGLFTDGSLLSAGRSSRLLARMEEKPDESAFPVVISDKTAGTVANPGKTGNSPNPRALSLLRDLSPEEENLMLALAVMEMTK